MPGVEKRLPGAASGRKLLSNGPAGKPGTVIIPAAAANQVLLLCFLMFFKTFEKF
jgi:hypothetical protein